jgi:hypothetical protein
LKRTKNGELTGVLGCVGIKTTLLQAEVPACLSGLAKELYYAFAIFIF